MPGMAIRVEFCRDVCARAPRNQSVAKVGVARLRVMRFSTHRPPLWVRRFWCRRGYWQMIGISWQGAVGLMVEAGKRIEIRRER